MTTAMVRMLKMARVLVAGVVLASCAALDSRPEVEEAQFGLIKQTPEGEILVEEAKRIPNRQGVVYGWRIRLETDRAELSWREEFVLPTAPDQWNTAGEEGITISADRTTAITERTVAIDDGEILNWWGVAEGDPSGEYVMRVYVEGDLVETFEFRLE